MHWPQPEGRVLTKLLQGRPESWILDLECQASELRLGTADWRERGSGGFPVV